VNDVTTEHLGNSETAIDVVTLEIIQSALVAGCEEMAEAMMRTAYSPIFAEGRDFAIALFDREGQMIAQGTGCPSQLGAMPMLVEWSLYDVGLDNIHPGDVLMHNDAYRGGTHLPEFTMIRPIHVGDELVGFAANIAHHVDIGGKSAGGFPGDATDVFMEGFRLPIMKLYERGEPNRDVWRVYLANTRLPVNAYGDLHAMYSSLLIAQRRIVELVERYGVETYLGALDEALDYSERLMRAEIRNIPDGVYLGSEVMEDDGVSDDGPFEIKVMVVVDGDDMVVDFTGSARQARGPINCPLGVTASGTYNGLLQLTDPAIPTNSGCFRPIRLIAPPGTIMNVKSPGACYGGNTETHNRVVDVIHNALVGAIPDRAAAPTGSTCCNLTYGSLDPDTGEYSANYQWDAIGWGGSDRHDGNSAIIAPGGNSRIQSIEVIENRFPWLVHSYGLRPDSGGPGRHRGGLGTVRELEATRTMQINGLSDRFIYPARGLEGGGPGATGEFMIRRAGSDEWKPVTEDSGAKSPSKFADVTVYPGDRVRFSTPGGGGFGDPADRDPEALRADLLAGYVSAEAADTSYGRAPDLHVAERPDAHDEVTA
jgi:N-methylhydantoinase B/oxoprolinase/acetone carboxylase alpha subunit